MTPDQETLCEEAANKLFTYEQLEENFTNCECNAYPELCTELFKNRFLLDKVSIIEWIRYIVLDGSLQIC